MLHTSQLLTRSFCAFSGYEPIGMTITGNIQGVLDRAIRGSRAVRADVTRTQAFGD